MYTSLDDGYVCCSFSVPELSCVSCVSSETKLESLISTSSTLAIDTKGSFFSKVGCLASTDGVSGSSTRYLWISMSPFTLASKDTSSAGFNEGKTIIVSFKVSSTNAAAPSDRICRVWCHFVD